MKKQRMKRWSRRTTTSSTPVVPSPQQPESVPLAHSPPIDVQSSPDLSKRKYIYKDIATSNNQSSQMNWVGIERESLCLSHTDTPHFPSGSFNARNNHCQCCVLISLKRTVSTRSYRRLPSTLDQTQSVSHRTLDHMYRPLHIGHSSISLPDIRIGLSRHRTTKHLHRTIVE